MNRMFPIYCIHYNSLRTVYYHEDFDSMSSGDEDLPVKSKKRKPAPKAKNKRSADNSSSSKSVKKQKTNHDIEIEENGKERRGPKVINTLTRHDESFPIFSPFKDGKFNEKSANIYDQIVKSVQVLGDGKKATDGVSVRNIKSYLEKHFKRNVQQKQFSKKLNDAVNSGISKGQFIKTSIGKVF